MTKLGWSILALIVIVVGGFLSVLSIGTVRRPPSDRTSQIVPGDESGLRVPVLGVARTALSDSWGDARGGGTRHHHGTDIPAAAGTTVVAASDGTVEKLFDSRLGGTTLYMRSPDRRWIYYYAHLRGYAPGIREGLRVAAGDPLGYVGDTGDAGPGNYHLHFGLARAAPGDRWWQGRDVDPYPVLASGRLPR